MDFRGLGVPISVSTYCTQAVDVIYKGNTEVFSSCILVPAEILRISSCALTLRGSKEVPVPWWSCTQRGYRGAGWSCQQRKGLVGLEVKTPKKLPSKACNSSSPPRREATEMRDGRGGWEYKYTCKIHASQEKLPFSSPSPSRTRPDISQLKMSQSLHPSHTMARCHWKNRAHNRAPHEFLLRLFVSQCHRPPLGHRIKPGSRSEPPLAALFHSAPFITY